MLVNSSTVTESHREKSQGNNNNYTKHKQSREQQACGRYGKLHEPRRCPAWGKVCSKCNGKNHFAQYCRTKGDVKHEIHEVNTDSDDETLYIGAVDNESDKTNVNGDNTEPTEDEWWVTVRMKGKRIKLKIDSGAKANIISRKTYLRIAGKVKLYKTKTKLMTYNKKEITVVGTWTIKTGYKQKYNRLQFYVVPDSENIIGLRAAVALNLIQRVYEVRDSSILDEYADVFNGIGCFEKKHHVELKEDAKPVIHPPRKVPIALKGKLKNELDRLDKLGIIKKVDKPTDWVNSLVIVEKPKGDLRLCLDPKDLNQAVKREHYQIPTIDELSCELAGAQYFSVLDANSGFWQIELDGDSVDLCTFNTPFGRHAFKRLPFGLHSAPEVFHKYMIQMIDGIEGTMCYIDDILVSGKTKEEHDARLRQVLDAARKYNVKLNRSKCKIGLSEIQYLGQILTKDGMKPDYAKVQAIQEMPAPTCKKDLQRFLGSIQYIGKYIPTLSEITSPLRLLLKDDIEWHWNESQESAFKKLKDLATNAPTLKYSDVNKDTIVIVDASQNSLGAELRQDGETIAFGYRALTETQKNYAQIEKEMLAIKFGCEKFHQFIYGKPTTMITDHKPLESICKKPLSAAPPRLLRMLLAVQKYDISIVHRPGTSKDLLVADMLSRAYPPETKKKQTKDKDDKEIELQVHMLIVTNLPISDEKRNELKIATAQDENLQKLKQTVKLGWPDTKHKVPDGIRPYWDFRDEIHEADDLMFKGNKLIIPKSKQHEMLQQIHGSHLGVQKCKTRARDVLFGQECLHRYKICVAIVQYA